MSLAADQGEGIVNTLQGFIDQFGPVAGTKMYRAVRSRAAYKGVCTRRRRRIETLTGRAYRPGRKSLPANGQHLLPLGDAGERDGDAGRLPADSGR
jgi:hypothetical protein